MRRLALVALAVGLPAACSSFETGQPPPTTRALDDSGAAEAAPTTLCTDCKPTVLTTRAPGIYSLAIDSESLFAGADDGRILRIAKSTGDVVPLATGQKNARVVTSAGSWIYFGADNGVFRVAKTGQPLQKLSDIPETAIAVAGDQTYACRYEVTDIIRLDPSGEGGVKVGNASGCESMAASRELVLFGSSNTLNRARLDGADAGRTVLGNYPARKIAVDGDYVYSLAWADGAVRRIRVDAEHDDDFEIIATIDDTTTEAGDLAVDATHVYWTIGKDAGRVLRAPKSIGGVEVLAEGLGHPTAIAVDDTSVYWGEEDSGTLWVRRK